MYQCAGDTSARMSDTPTRARLVPSDLAAYPDAARRVHHVEDQLAMRLDLLQVELEARGVPTEVDVRGRQLYTSDRVGGTGVTVGVAVSLLDGAPCVRWWLQPDDGADFDGRLADPPAVAGLHRAEDHAGPYWYDVSTLDDWLDPGEFERQVPALAARFLAEVERARRFWLEIAGTGSG
ncbi:MAG: hypothetical protein ACK4YP_17550 [Myxococcota bacterium]